MKKNNFKIVIATGIFYPAPGGPAIHTRRIAGYLRSLGHKVVVVTYSATPKPDDFLFTVRRVTGGTKVTRWIRYTFTLAREVIFSDVVYAFDLTSAGIPAFVLAKIFRKHFIIRVGGDPIWEHVVERNKRFISLFEYYEQRFQYVDNPFLYWVIKFLLKRSDAIIVYSPSLKDFYIRNFYIRPDKFFVIPNPHEPKEKSQINTEHHPVFLFAGRFVLYKNLLLVIDAFNEVWNIKRKGELRIIGDGPEKKLLIEHARNVSANNHIIFLPTMSHKELFDEIRNASVALAPALTEYSPNFILESISLGKPAIISSGHGMVVDWPDWLTFNPYSKEELVKIMSMFYENDFYKKSQETVSLLKPFTTWAQVLSLHQKILERILR